MTGVIYRDARLEDIPAMADVFLASIGDMFSRYGITETPPPRAALIGGYPHLLSTGIFRLAELDSRIVAIASAVIRDDVWFLSTFWVLPDQQHNGVGMPLLRELWQAGKDAGATTFSTHSSPDVTAMAAYMKMGMFPDHQIIYFRGKSRELLNVPSGYESVPLEKVTAMELDLQMRGTRREPDHEYWVGAGGMKGRQVLHHGKVVGYYYLGRSGIGPAAWNQAEAANAVMALACRQASEVTPEIRFSVPGINHAALRFALDSGLRVVSAFHLLTTHPLGRMEQYIPSGPSLY